MERRSNIDNTATEQRQRGAGRHSSSSGKIMSQRIDLCSADEIAPGSAIKVETGDLVLAVYNVDGEYFVTDDLCTHGPGSLSEGYIDGDVVECNFHNGQFN